MGVRFFTPEGRYLPIASVLQPFLESKADGASTTDEMRDYILEELSMGKLQMDPSPTRLVEMAIGGSVRLFTENADHGSIRRFGNDRANGRFDRKVKRAADWEEESRERCLESIRLSMVKELPSAYRRQAALLADIDPTVDAKALAKEVSQLVHNAVVEGIASAKEQAA